MKHLLYILLFFAASTLHAQNQFWIGDSVRVHCFTDPSFNDDTVAYVKTKYDNAKTGQTIIYWDKEFKHKFIGYTHDPQMPYSGDTMWHSNGQLYRVVKAFGDQANGNLVTKGWFYDGTREIETVYDSIKMLTTCYYHSGKVKQIQTSIKGFTKAWPDHYQFIYIEKRCENGNIIVSDSVITQVPHKVTRYYCNGNKELEHNIWNGRPNGKFTYWYENGNVKEEGQFELYKDTAYHYPSNGMPRKQGQWNYYNESGKLTKTEWYKDDKLVKTEVKD